VSAACGVQCLGSARRMSRFLRAGWALRAVQRRCVIFDLVRDNRSSAARLWSTCVSVVLNAAVILGIVVASQVAAVRNSTQRVAEELRRHIGEYRMILLVAPGRIPGVPPAPAAPPVARKPRPAPQPLPVPDPRLLDRVDPRIGRFVRDNPEIESIVTRELVRDLDSRLLDPKKILEKSSLRLVFDLSESGTVLHPKIEKSSRVPSIDHLALELAKLIEAYGVLASVQGLARVAISIDVGEEIVVQVEGVVRDPQDTEKVKKQAQNLLAISRFLFAKSEGAFLLQDIAVESAGGRVSLRRAYEKKPLVDFLARYYAAPEK
jgi:hypothetical protein